MSNETHHHLTRHALAMRVHLQHENERMREALHVIEDIAATSPDPKSMRTIAQIARSALAPSQPPHPEMTR
ncbi:hypothetical protein [Paraburkholderia adhaesiva]|uniref:hypothetical protein n=1 Tax=Paraburkholderia adhaesiva TaxID=2883244 RepID=UPI001F473463|nr:hypothetical protein [Paraburkholderia adhaesiva]